MGKETYRVNIKSDSIVNETEKYRLFEGWITYVDEENYFCSVYIDEVGAQFDSVPLTFPYIGHKGFIGTLPEVGTWCYLTWPKGSSSTPIILNYLDAFTSFPKDFSLNRELSSSEELSEFQKEFGKFSFNRLRRTHKLYPGNTLVESSQGSSVFLDENVTISNKRLNEISMRSSDQTINFQSLVQNFLSGGIRRKSGIAVRNNEFGWLKSLDPIKENSRLKTNFERFNEIRKLYSSVLDDGSFHYIITPNKADRSAGTRNPNNLDYLQTKEQLRTGLISNRQAPDFWGLPPKSLPNSSTGLDDLAYTEDRVEIRELHNTVLDVSEEVYDFDSDFPTATKENSSGFLVDPDRFSRKKRSEDLFIIHNLGTLISNDPNTVDYGRVLIPNLFNDIFATSINTTPYISAKTYAELSFEENKVAGKIEDLERKYGSAFHLSFPQNSSKIDKKEILSTGGIEPPKIIKTSNPQISDFLKVNADGAYWGGQLSTNQKKYNEDPQSNNKPLPSSYTRFDFLKSGNLLFNIAASEEEYGQLKGTATNKNWFQSGFGPTSGPGVSIFATTDTEGETSEKLGGWSIEGNIEGGSKLILGKDLTRRISLAFQTYGMLFGTIGNDSPLVASTTDNNPDEPGSNNSYNIKIEGKGRLFQGKNIRDQISSEYRADGRVFYHLGSAKGDIHGIEINQSGGNISEARQGKQIKNSPNGSLNGSFFNVPGGVVYRTANTSLELATDGSIHIPFVGKEENTNRSLTIYTDGSIEIGHENEPIGANKENGEGDDKTFNQSFKVIPQKAMQIRIGTPKSNGSANSPLAEGSYKQGNSTTNYDRKEPLNKGLTGVQSGFDSSANQARNAIKNNGVGLDIEVWGNAYFQVHGNEYKYVKENSVSYVEGDSVEYVKGKKYLYSGDDIDFKAKSNYKLDAGRNIEEKCREMKVEASSKITLDGSGTQLIAQRNNIQMKNGGTIVQVQGSNVNLG